MERQILSLTPVKQIGGVVSEVMSKGNDVEG